MLDSLSKRHGRVQELYLKKLEIQGFKSFADKICVEFRDGITSVVGPNGSGKSNISDSIRWVLGEQSAKSLRGGKMEDVIFAGTQQRKPLGFAQVSLTIQNETKILPVDFGEVTITRRVYRSGEGEYFINKVPCRLKDIHELFLDTGIGRDGYSVIGQGRIDEILSTKSEDRRAIFEEASGIMKYKIRKIEAERKLETTENNLLRIRDIIEELEKQLEPLGNQAGTAKRYLSLREELKGLEVSVFLENISSSKEKILQIEDHLKIIQENKEGENKKLLSKTSENRESVQKLKEMEEELEHLTKQFYEQENGVERCTSDINLNKEKVGSFENNIKRLEVELLNLEEKEKEVSIEIQDKKQKLVEFSQKTNKDYERLSRVENQYAKLLENLDGSQKKIEGLNVEFLSKMRIQSDLNLKRSERKNALEHLIQRQDNIRNEITITELSKVTEENKKTDKIKGIEEILKDIQTQEKKRQTLEKEKRELSNDLEQTEKKLNHTQNEMQFKTSKKKMLLNMEANMDGYFRSIKEILKECDRNPEFKKGIHGPLFKLIDVSGKHATAIELALGGALQNIVTSKEEDAKKAIEFLKKGKFGRGTFLPITSIKGKGLEDHIVEKAQGMRGFVGIASELITFDPQYESIVLNLLGKVVVVENLDAGIEMAKQFGYRFKIVTLEGDVLSTTGSMSGGSNDGKDSGILNRSAQITEITNEIHKLEVEINKYRNNKDSLKGMLLEVSEETKFSEDALRNLEHKKIREESHLGQIVEILQKMKEKIETLKIERENFSAVLEKGKKEVSAVEEEILLVDKEVAGIKAYISKHQDAQKEGQGEREKLLTEITDLKVNLSALKETVENYGGLIQRLLVDQDDLKGNIISKNDEKKRGKIEIERLLNSNILIEEKIKNAQKIKSQKELLIKEKNQKKTELEKSGENLIELLKDINQNIRLFNEEEGRLQIKKAKLEAEVHNFQNRLWEEYELTYHNALPLKEKLENYSIAQKTIQDLKNEIRNLGPVNVGAIEEYKKSKERYDFLKAQKDDLDHAKEKLKKLITEMLQIMKGQFIEQFRLINENFGKVFQELFQGGRAELKLLDQDNVLESGIDIEVQPPGKKLQNMMLLSGGERAFTAIALLFAILKLRPAPFCLLDEIEAALDDANVHRFAQYIKQHTHLTQFLVITHRKGTMEASDDLYGVTMQEQGISNIYSMKLGQN
jgi:chromosome segregation protein